MRSVFEFIRQKMKFEVRNVRRKNDGSEKKKWTKYRRQIVYIIQNVECSIRDRKETEKNVATTTTKSKMPKKSSWLDNKLCYL